MNKDEPRILPHSYDGLQEYDNPLPGWWSWTFLVCCLFAVGYFAFYHLGPGVSETQAYAAEHEVYEAKMAERRKAEEREVSEVVLAKLSRDPEALAKGKAVFALRCVACHTDNGRGLVGPNLTDEFQIHGSTRMEIFNTVKDGVPAKGMISWAPILKIDEMKAVVGYIASLRGTNVPGGKAPEGSKVGSFSD